jgi:hypothetical protein
MDEMKRPRRVLGDAIRMHLSCPLCREKVELRVAAYRRRSIRIECRKCELHFSIDFGSFANALMDKPDVVLDGSDRSSEFLLTERG